ncbi:hypothetical protein BGZ60DRAFT_398209 [Tricladium varicosporioides]|nr:hypothetical protein BGZ60DRAFT_398209 [Hymenoscyphus varicosporioides]
MAESRHSRFTVIIVGGSVGGLTLAHMLTHAKINYILLEARDTLSPQLGAGIVIMPNGARILEQLGIYESMDDFMTPMTRQNRYKSDGTLISSVDWPRIIEERLSYPAGILERQSFLLSLHKQLEDKSKIHLKKKVVIFEHNENYVKVKCEDGSEFFGDIVVGTDGIHSKTRQEMQRFAEETGPPGMMDKDKISVTAQYNAFFGISDPMLGLNPGDSNTASDIHHSSLLFVSKYGLPQWFFFSKMPKRFQGKDIPRFTKEQMEQQVEEFADFQFVKGVTLKDLMGKTRSLSYLPLEEASHNFWTYKRIVCAGDSIHKMTPNMGQGGNQAIESVATLTNCLVDMLVKAGKTGPTTAEVEKALQRYQKLRKRRAAMFVKLSALVTRDEALDTLSHTLRFLFLEPFNGEQVADFQMDLYTMAPYLNFLPIPARTVGNKYWEAGMELSRNNAVPKLPGTHQVPKARL